MSIGALGVPALAFTIAAAGDAVFMPVARLASCRRRLSGVELGTSKRWRSNRRRGRYDE
jgi:hypothetical protein